MSRTSWWRSARKSLTLDAYNWAENYALEHSPSPEQLVMLAEEQTERDRLAVALREALAYATPTQARRIRAYYLGGLTQQQIADCERVHNSNVCLSIRRGLCNLRRYYADHHLGK